MPHAHSSTLVIIGAGGHGRVVADAVLASGSFVKVLATDADPARSVGELLPTVELLADSAACALDASFHVAVGHAEARRREIGRLAGRPLATVTHPRASVSPHSVIGDACFIAAQAVVAPRASLGVSVIVNHGAVVDHDVVVGDFSHIAPLTALGGGVRIGARVLMGSGSRVLPGVSICDDVIVGAGAVVLSPITEPGVYAGVPARRIR